MTDVKENWRECPWCGNPGSNKAQLKDCTCKEHCVISWCAYKPFGFGVGDKIRHKSSGLTQTILDQNGDMWIFSRGYQKKVFGKERFVSRPIGIPKDDDRWEKVK